MFLPLLILEKPTNKTWSVIPFLPVLLRRERCRGDPFDTGRTQSPRPARDEGWSVDARGLHRAWDRGKYP